MRKYAIAYFIIAVSFYLVFTGFRIRSDGQVYYAMAEALSNGNLSLENEVYLNFYLKDYRFLVGKINPVTHKIISIYSPGHTLIYYPFFYIGNLLKNYERFVVCDIQLLSITKMPYHSVFMVWLANLLFLFLSFFYLHLIIKKLFNYSDFSIMVMIVILFLASLWVCYATYHFFYLHNLEIFISIMLFWFWLKEKYNSRVYFIVLSFIFSYLIFIRLINAFLYVVLIGYAIINAQLASKKLVSIIKAAFFCFLGSLPIMIFLVYCNYSNHGRFLALGYERGMFTPGSPIANMVRLFYYYLHPVRGLFIWQPITILSIIGIVMYNSRKMRNLFAASLIIFSACVAMNRFWWGGASFGQRFFFVCMPFFAVGLASFKKYKTAFYVISSVFAIYSFSLFLLYLGSAHANQGQFYTPFSMVKSAIKYRGLIIRNIRNNSINSPYNAYDWIVKKLLLYKKPQKIEITSGLALDKIDIPLPESLRGKEIKYFSQVYVNSKRIFPHQFLAKFKSEAIILEKNFNMNLSGLPYLYLTLSSSPNNQYPAKAILMNYNTLLNSYDGVNIVMLMVDSVSNEPLCYYNITSQKKYDPLANTYIKKAVYYDDKSEAYKEYYIESHSDSNAVMLFWQREGEPAFYIENYVARQREKLVIPFRSNVLSRYEFKGTLWVVAQNEISFLEKKADISQSQKN